MGLSSFPSCTPSHTSTSGTSKPVVELALKAALDCAPAFSRFRPNVDPSRLIRSLESALCLVYVRL
jgi:hypothetical protein